MIVNRYNNVPAKPRVVICGIGLYGGLVSRALKDVGYEIAGAYNRAGPKIGKDLGEATRQDCNYGVIVEDIATADLTKTGAHVGICTQSNDLRVDMPTYKRLMSAGINVISLAMEAYYPFGSDAEAAAEIDAFARQSGVTFTGSGIHDMTRIWSGIIACGQCTMISSIHHESLTDSSDQQRPDQLLRGWNAIGTSVEDYLASGVDKGRLWPVYTLALEHILKALRYTPIQRSVRVEPIVWDEPFESDYLQMVIPAGRVLGTRTIGQVKTKEGVTAAVKTEARLLKKGEEDYTLWSIEGKPRSEIRIKRLDADYTSAACLVGRVPDVIAASPGIVLVSQYGPLQGPELASGKRL
jgi:4-hydroxy-tetrahydrodipicolinate reductase